MTMNWLKHVAAAAFAIAVAGCADTATRGDLAGPVAAAPSLHVGARWTYRGREGFRMPVVWEETREVTAANADGLSIRVTRDTAIVGMKFVDAADVPGTTVPSSCSQVSSG